MVKTLLTLMNACLSWLGDSHYKTYYYKALLIALLLETWKNIGIWKNY